MIIKKCSLIIFFTFIFFSSEVFSFLGSSHMQGHAKWIDILAGNPQDARSLDTLGYFNNPNGITSDGKNYFIADTNNHIIRKLDDKGVLTTIAGVAGLKGSLDGNGSAARFNFPSGITYDASSKLLYVTDSFNHTIRQIDSLSNSVTTIAGTAGVRGARESGAGSSELFNYPTGITWDSKNKLLYVVDTFNHAVRLLTPNNSNPPTSWTTTTFAGTLGQSGNSNGSFVIFDKYSFPSAIAIDSRSNSSVFYLTDTYNNQVIQIYYSNGFLGLGAGWVSNLLLIKANLPTGIVVDSNGIIYYSSFGLNSIIKFNPSSSSLSYLVNSSNGSTILQGPTGLYSENGNSLLIADSGHNLIKQYFFTNSNGNQAGTLSTLVGNASGYGSLDAQGRNAKIYYPNAMTTDNNGNVFVADTYNHAIKKIDFLGNVTTFAGSASLPGSNDANGISASFNFPNGITYFNNTLYIADTNNSTIRKIDLQGNVSTIAGLPGQYGLSNTSNATQFNSPHSICADSSGNLFVADTYNNVIRKITMSTTSPTVSTFASGFNFPRGIACDNTNNIIYVADTENNVIKKIIMSSGATSTVVSSGLVRPLGLTVDRDGFIFVADTENNGIKKYSTSGNLIKTAIGTTGARAANSTYPASLSLPTSVALPTAVTYGNGMLYIATENAILKVPSP